MLTQLATRFLYQSPTDSMGQLAKPDSCGKQLLLQRMCVQTMKQMIRAHPSRQKCKRDYWKGNQPITQDCIDPPGRSLPCRQMDKQRQTPDCGFHRRHMVTKESTCQQREKWLIAGYNYPSKHREVPVILWSMIGICVQWVSNFHLLHFFHLKTNHRGQHSCFYKSRDRQTKSILAVSGTEGQESSETNTKANHEIKKILIYCC